MSINFRAALRYPFTGSNCLNAWIFPALYILLMQILAFTTVLMIRQAFPEMQGAASEMILLPFILLINIGLSGLLWVLADRVQTQGAQNEMPSFWACILRYIQGGVKLFPYIFLVKVFLSALALLPILPGPQAGPSMENIGITLLVVAVLTIFLGPILAAPVIQSAQLREVRALFNFPRTMSLLREHYLSGVQAMSLGVVIFVMYAGIIIFLMSTPETVNWSGLFTPFLLVPMLVSIWHLLCQGMPMAVESWPGPSNLRAV